MLHKYTKCDVPNSVSVGSFQEGKEWTHNSTVEVLVLKKCNYYANCKVRQTRLKPEAINSNGHMGATMIIE